MGEDEFGPTSVDAIAETLANADDQTWVMLSAEERERYREQAHAIEGLIDREVERRVRELEDEPE